MRSKLTGAVALLFILAYASVFPAFEGSRKAIKSMEVKGLTLPPTVVKLMSIEFRTLVADFFFIRASQFVGGRVQEGRKPSREDWNWLYRNLDLTTELDPYFQDPYYMGNGFLTWDAGMFKEANDLLQKATDARTWDWWFPFFIGFNKFFFLGENREAADYLLLAHERPGAWPILPNLAARLYYKGGRTGAAIAFLAKFWENETDENIKKEYETRIEALRSILLLEKAVARYREETGKNPESLEMLVEAGIIDKIPEDPYKGRFYMDRDGTIKTTSKLAFAHLQKAEEESSPPPDQSQ